MPRAAAIIDGVMLLEDARELSRAVVGGLRPRWDHVQAVGQLAEDLSGRAELSETVVVAAWLHDIGYGGSSYLSVG